MGVFFCSPSALSCFTCYLFSYLLFILLCFLSLPSLIPSISSQSHLIPLSLLLLILSPPLTILGHLLRHLLFFFSSSQNTHCPKYFSLSLLSLLYSYLLFSLSPSSLSPIREGRPAFLSQGDSEHLELLLRYVKQFIRRREV